MNLSIGSKIGAGFAIVLIALLAIGIVTSVELNQLTTDTGWVTHTVEVQKQLETLEAGLLQAESSARGYRLSPDSTLETSFRTAIGKATDSYAAVRELTSDNPVQQLRLDKMEQIMTDRIGQLRQLMTLPSNPLADDALPRQRLVHDGEQSMASIRGLISDMIVEEQRLLASRGQRATQMENLTSDTIIYGTLIAAFLILLVGKRITSSITSPLRQLGEGASIIGGGNYTHRVPVTSRDEVGQMATLFNRMAGQVQERQDSLAEQDELKQKLARFSSLFQSQRDLTVLCRGVLSELGTLLNARHSVFYLAAATSEGPFLKLEAAYAFDQTRLVLKPGEGLAGQCLVDQQRIVLRDIPQNYLKITSALGEAHPTAVIIQPVIFDNALKAVLELALDVPPTPPQLTFLDQFSASLGIVLNTVAAVMKTEELLREARRSEQLLQEQQEELQQTNEEMEQTNEEMQQTNEEMEEKVNLLAEQKKQLERANREIDKAREELEKRSSQIAQGSRYKSEFLANMSHELRTPLNSLLILSKMLADNPETNLTAKQVQYAKTIYSSGNDLLALINEVLDLAKIESGSVAFEPSPMAFSDLRGFLEQTFRHVAEGKNLSFDLDFALELPSRIMTDPRRLQQVLKNMLSNAFKFTEKGGIILKVRQLSRDGTEFAPMLKSAAGKVAFSVTDTGIGVPADKHDHIFEAFQQAEAGTARKYGGTGLGLSISRELAILLGGSLELTSSTPAGSTFTLFLPTEPENAPPRPVSAPARPGVSTQSQSPLSKDAQADTEPAEDDRANLQPGDITLLIIEDDKNFSGILCDLAREKKFKVLLARNASQGVALARKMRPSAITLDLHLPDNDGWVVLDQLKHDPLTRHVPIHIISVDLERERSLRLGAVSYLQKPVSRESLDSALTETISFINRPLKNLLIIEDDSIQRQGLADLIGDGDVQTTAVGSAAEALSALEKTRFDCVVIDLGLPDSSGLDLLRTIHGRMGLDAPPIIVYTGKDLSRAEETELRMISDSIVIKSVRSPERLLDETALFLHRVQAKLPEPKQRIIEQVQKSDSLLAGRNVLIVDDDVRNIFALTSALEASEMVVKYAESGQAAIDLLENEPGIEIVLMDVMMPEMDGFETIRRIRLIDRFRKLPIISVTAKAMKDDREKCLEAGASDYVTKPVDMDQLRSLLRVWLYR